MTALAKLAKLVAGLGTITAFIVGGAELVKGTRSFFEEVNKTLRTSRDVAEQVAAERKRSQLSSFGTYAQLLSQHRNIALRTVTFIHELDRSGGYCGRNAARLRDFLPRFGNGSVLYFSPEMKEYREIHEFYEDLGLQVREGAVEYELIFELVTFPTDFVKKTRCLGELIGDNWFGPGEPIVGFNSNSFYLMERYSASRRESARKAGRLFKEPANCDCSALLSGGELLLQYWN
ncbi:MAG: hypothetical protein QM784_09385 [Polyangiaceae bacterium]